MANKKVFDYVAAVEAYYTGKGKLTETAREMLTVGFNGAALGEALKEHAKKDGTAISGTSFMRSLRPIFGRELSKVYAEEMDNTDRDAWLNARGFKREAGAPFPSVGFSTKDDAVVLLFKPGKVGQSRRHASKAVPVTEENADKPSADVIHLVEKADSTPEARKLQVMRAIANLAALMEKATVSESNDYAAMVNKALGSHGVKVPEKTDEADSEKPTPASRRRA